MLIGPLCLRITPNGKLTRSLDRKRTGSSFIVMPVTKCTYPLEKFAYAPPIKSSRKTKSLFL